MDYKSNVRTTACGGHCRVGGRWCDCRGRRCDCRGRRCDGGACCAERGGGRSDRHDVDCRCIDGIWRLNDCGVDGRRVDLRGRLRRFWRWRQLSRRPVRCLCVVDRVGADADQSEHRQNDGQSRRRRFVGVNNGTWGAGGRRSLGAQRGSHGAGCDPINPRA